MAAAARRGAGRVAVERGRAHGGTGTCMDGPLSRRHGQARCAGPGAPRRPRRLARLELQADVENVDFASPRRGSAAQGCQRAHRWASRFAVGAARCCCPPVHTRICARRAPIGMASRWAAAAREITLHVAEIRCVRCQRARCVRTHTLTRGVKAAMCAYSRSISTTVVSRSSRAPIVLVRDSESSGRRRPVVSEGAPNGAAKGRYLHEAR